MSGETTTEPALSPSGLPSARAAALVALLLAAMVVSTYQQGALAVLSADVIATFDITRSQLGLTFTAASLLGAALAPLIGRVADRRTRRTLVAMFIVSSVGILLASAAPAYLVLLVATLIGGSAVGFANPVTNRIIAERVSIRRRGMALGLKQAGPPMAFFLAGVTLPLLAITFGWRLAMASGVVLAAAGLIATFVLVPGALGTTDVAESRKALPRHVRASVLWLNAIGFGIAVGNGAIIAFLPLYAQETVGLSPTLAGLVASTMGLCGVVGRIAWGSQGHRFERPSTALIIIAGLAVLGAVLIGLAAVVGPVTLWAGAVVAGGSSFAWHAVAWLVILDRVGTAGVGRASGIMQTGSSTGFAIGPFVAGSAIDATGSYWAAWGPVALTFAVVMAATIAFRRGAVRRRQAMEEQGRRSQ